MNAKLRTKLKAWPERHEATVALMRAIQNGNLRETKQLLARFPLLDHWVPYNAQCWSQISAAAGQLNLMNYWRDREKKTRTVSKRASLESLLFWSMGDDYVDSSKGDPARVAEYLLKLGADIDGDLKDYSPLHRAVFKNRPQLVELLIRRGANLARRYVTGESALQIAEGFPGYGKCASLLKRAGAPRNLPQKPERPTPTRTVDLRPAATKLKTSIASAVRRFARQHGKQLVTAIALASVPHEGYVMVSFDTGEFDGNPWDCTYDEFSYIRFRDWAAAHEGDTMRLVDLDGRTREDEPDAFLQQFKKMIVVVLTTLEREGAFSDLKIAKGCRLGIEMTLAGEAKFWRLRREKKDR